MGLRAKRTAGEPLLIRALGHETDQDFLSLLQVRQEQALKLAPNDAGILATLGEIYREEKEYELSKEALEAALSIDPSFSIAEVGLALSLTQMGHLSEAAQIVERQVLKGNRSINLLYMLSQLPKSLVGLDVISLIDEASPPRRKGATPRRPPRPRGLDSRPSLTAHGSMFGRGRCRR